MNSPKDILLRQHADADSSLNEVRNRIVAGLRPKTKQRFSAASFLAEAWNQLFWQSRNIWASLATVWIALLIIGSTTAQPGSIEVPVAANPAETVPPWEKHHDRLRAELGIPLRQHAQNETKQKPTVPRRESNRPSTRLYT